MSVEKNFMFVAKALDFIQKVRVATQVRINHLGKQEKQDDISDIIYKKSLEMELLLNTFLKQAVKAHPAYPWFKDVKGIGEINIGKVLAYIDIEIADTISSLWRYAGYAVVDGKSERPTPGQKLSYNKKLRVNCYRMGTGLIKAKGVYYHFYLEAKARIEQKRLLEGLKIVSGREKEGTISKGHINLQAMRKMIKLFLAHLWVVWREAEGLEVTKPYAMTILNHSGYLDPWEMVEEKPKKKSKKAA